MQLFKRKKVLDSLHREDKDLARRKFIRNSIAGMFGAAALAKADDLFSLESKTGYVYVKQDGTVVNDFKPMGSTTPYLGQIVMFGFDFAPNGWQKCIGQLLPISFYGALFALFGTQYGGNGTTTFGVPDFRGRVPISFGAGAGLSNVNIGDKAGSESVTLTNFQIPQHTHQVNASSSVGSSSSPSGNYFALNAEGINSYSATADNTLNGSAIANTGTGNAHTNIQPIIAVNFCVAISGVFPSHH